MNNVASEVAVNIPSDNGYKLAEIGQTKSIRFAFLAQTGEKEYQPFHPTVKCRDFLNDIIQAKAIGEDVDIYGLRLQHKDNVLNEDSFKMLVTFGSEGEASQFDHSFEFLLEKEFSFFDCAPSKLFAVKGDGKKFVIEADKYWQRTTWRASLYTYMCRVMMYLDRPDSDWTTAMSTTSVDGAYMDQMLCKGNFIKKLPLLRQLDPDKAKTPSGFAKNDELFASHEYGGILSLVNSAHPDNQFVKQLNTLCAAA